MEENKSAADDTLRFTVYSCTKAGPLHVKQAHRGGRIMTLLILEPGASESLHLLHS